MYANQQAPRASMAYGLTKMLLTIAPRMINKNAASRFVATLLDTRLLFSPLRCDLRRPDPLNSS